MTSLLTARRRAEEFAAAVDGDAQSAGLAPGISELVQVVALLQAHESATPRAEFAGDLRSRLMTEAETVLHPESARLLLPVRSRGPRERRLVAAASAVVLLGGTASMAAAAQDALPGDLLYPIKRGIEVAEARLSFTPAGRGHDLLDQASARLTEVNGLVSADSVTSTPQVPDTLAKFTVQASDGSRILLDSFQETRDPESVTAVRSFAADAIGMLEQLADEVPADAQDELTAAALALRDIDERASALCSTCGSGSDLEVPGIFLARAEVDRAMRSVVTRELDNSHPVVVPKQGGNDAQSAKENSGGAPAGVSPETVGDNVPDSGATNEAPPPVATPQPGTLPSIDVELDADPAPSQAPAGNGAGNPVGGLGDVVETLLPDVDLP